MAEQLQLDEQGFDQMEQRVLDQVMAVFKSIIGIKQ